MTMKNDLHILFLPAWFSTPSNEMAGIFFQEQAESLVKFGQRVGIIHVNGFSIREWRKYHDIKWKVIKLSRNNVEGYQYLFPFILCHWV